MNALNEAFDQAVLALMRDALAAARGGHTAVLRQLIDRGVPIDVRNDKGDSLLMLASYHGHELTAELLLQRGADPELANDRGQTPLQGVAFKGDLALIRVLLDGGACVDGGGPDGKTPLMFAAMFNRIEVIKLLLVHGADRTRRDVTGATASSLAGAMGAEQARALLDPRR